jgi:pimeloyl-ACP methyl ester carboxylesterase
MTLDEKKEFLLQQCDKRQNLTEITTETHPIHITEWGNSGPIVLMIHGGVQGGLGGGPINFINQRELADKGYKLRVPNRPGFGESPSRGVDSQTADAVWIAEELGKGSHLVGHSFGGAEALLAAAIRPEAVQSLILIEPALQPILATDVEGLKLPEIQEALQVVSAPLMAAESPGDFARLFSECMGEAVDGGLNPSAAALEDHPESASDLGCALLNAVLGTPQEMRAAADIVKAKGIPVYVISGGYSPSQDACCKAIARLTGGKHIIIPCPNHFIQQDSAKLFNEFLDKEIQNLL